MRVIRTDPMALVTLNPYWVDHRTRRGVAVAFDCPCRAVVCPVGGRRVVPFTNPLDGGKASEAFLTTWQRTGETFETLVLHPSILVRGHWHGWLGGSDGGVPGILVSC